MNKSPELKCFCLCKIEVSIPSATRDRSYRVVFAGVEKPRCQCESFHARGICRHQNEASDFLFSEAGLWESLELLTPQLTALENAVPDSVDFYRLRALEALHDEIAGRFGEVEFGTSAPTVNCPCGNSFAGTGDTVCHRCKITVREAWNTFKASPVEQGEYDDSDPFADDSDTNFNGLSPSAAAAAAMMQQPIKPQSYYASFLSASLVMESGRVAA